METTSTNLHLTFPSFPGVSNNDNDVAGIDSHMLFGGRIIIPSSRATFWNEPTTLQEFIEDQFQKPTQHDENISNDPIPANRFRVVNLRRDFKIEVQWTDDLREHLSFDRRVCVLRIFVQRNYISLLSYRLEEKPPCHPIRAKPRLTITIVRYQFYSRT